MGSFGGSSEALSVELLEDFLEGLCKESPRGYLGGSSRGLCS